MRQKLKEESGPAPAPEPKRVSRGFFRDLYEHKYKHLMIITLALLFISGGIIVANFLVTGEWIKKDISLKGGISLTVMTDTGFDEVEAFFKERFPGSDYTMRKISGGFIIEAADIEEDTLFSAAQEKVGELNKDDYSIEVMGSALGASFFKETGLAIVIAFVLMAIVVFVTFRNLVPSLFVILAAFSDIVCTFAFTQLFGIKLSTAGIAAFLMLIGYSVDTDILLTTRVLRRKEGTVYDRTVGALKTGLTMSITSLVAISIGLIFSQSTVLRQIFIILFVGLLFDIINTWLQNAGILRWYLEKNVKD